MDITKKFNTVETVLATTIDDLSLFLKSFDKEDHDLVCSCCQGIKWEINGRPNDKEKPVIVTLPLPMVDGAGVWAFPITCTKCGEMKFFHTHKVAAWIHENKK